MDTIRETGQTEMSSTGHKSEWMGPGQVWDQIRILERTDRETDPELADGSGKKNPKRLDPST